MVAEFSLTPNLDYLILFPTFSKVPIEKYGKTNFFWQTEFYSYFQNPSEKLRTLGGKKMVNFVTVVNINMPFTSV